MAKPKKRRISKKFTKEEKKKIAKDMVEGYKKMAELNLELAEDGMNTDDETA
ncbi:MAG: hypothetical protein ACOCQO_02615 [Halanaerobiaceae bacterium]